jgi:predicted membrane-bound spermidine synthase
MKGLKYLNEDVMKRMPLFAPDIAKLEVEGNRLSTHRLIEYYDEGWKKWYE